MTDCKKCIWATTEKPDESKTAIYCGDGLYCKCKRGMQITVYSGELICNGFQTRTEISPKLLTNFTPAYDIDMPKKEETNGKTN